MHALLPAGSAQSAGRAAPARVSVWRPNPKARRPKLSRGKRGSARSQLDPSGPGLNPSEKSPSAKKSSPRPPAPLPCRLPGSHVAPPHAGSGAAARGRKPGVERRPVRRGRCAGGRRSAWVAARTSMPASCRTSSSRGTSSSSTAIATQASEKWSSRSSRPGSGFSRAARRGGRARPRRGRAAGRFGARGSAGKGGRPGTSWRRRRKKGPGGLCHNLAKDRPKPQTTQRLGSTALTSQGKNPTSIFP